MKVNAKKLFEKAIENLSEANKELYKPNEDIVSYSVCKHAQYAIENYLRGYLLQKGVNTVDFNTIEELFEQCKIIDKKFEKIDLSELDCKSHLIDSRYCSQVSKVSNCFDVADNIDTFFRQEKIID